VPIQRAKAAFDAAIRSGRREAVGGPEDQLRHTAACAEDSANRRGGAAASKFLPILMARMKSEAAAALPENAIDALDML
jgi:hypothetical protein